MAAYPVTDRKELILSLAMIVLAVALCYGRTMGYGFIQTWDDDAYVLNNTAAHGFSLPNLAAAFSNFYVGNYAPLHIVSYMIDHTFWGLNPAGYHAVNLLLHALNGFLLLQILRKTVDNHNTALFATLIFIIHPVQVESVAWISERKNLLGFLFIMLTLLLHMTWRSSENRKYYWASIIMTCAALLSKSVAVIIPVLLISWDYCFYQRQSGNSFIKKTVYLAPHIILCGVAALLTLESQQPDSGGGRVGYINNSAVSHLLIMMSAVTKYILNLLAPTSLAAFYDMPAVTTSDATVITGILILTGTAVSAWFLHCKSRPLFFCLILTISAMLPVSNIIPLNTFINDRYLYLPLAGIAPLFVVYLYQAIPAAKQLRNITAVSICLPLMYLSWQQCQTWENDISLWENAVQNTSKKRELLQSSVALNALTTAYIQGSRLKEAKHTAQQSLLQTPENITAMNNLGIISLQIEQFATAEYFLKKAIIKDPTYVHSYVNLAKTYLTEGQLVKAQEILNRALEFAPVSANLYGVQGALHLTSGNYLLARQAYTKAEQLGGVSKDISFGRACAEALDNNPQKALEYLEQAFRLGFRDRRTLESSSGFDSLRNLPHYRRLLAEYAIN